MEKSPSQTIINSKYNVSIITLKCGKQLEKPKKIPNNVKPKMGINQKEDFDKEKTIPQEPKEGGPQDCI